MLRIHTAIALSVAILVASSASIAEAAESRRGPAYLQLHPMGILIAEKGVTLPLEIHGGYHLSGRHDGLALGLTQKLIFGVGLSTVARVGYDVAVPLGEREMTIAPYAFGGAIYAGDDVGAHYGVGGELRFFPVAKPFPVATKEDVAPKQTMLVEVTADHIDIREKIQFRLNEAIIEKVSYALLDEVARVIKSNPQLKLIRIEGHASSEGDAGANMALSASRATAVRTYLVQKGGVAPEVLDARGLGITRPIASNDTAEGREKNRRVEFNIVKQDDKIQKTVEKTVSKSSGGEGFFFVVKPLELGFVTASHTVFGITTQVGVGYAF